MSIHYLQEPLCSIPPVNSYDVAEDANLDMARIERKAIGSDVLIRWSLIAMDANQYQAAVELAEEARRTIP
jgi:hypothetical protein